MCVCVCVKGTDRQRERETEERQSENSMNTLFVLLCFDGQNASHNNQENKATKPDNSGSYD